MDEHIKTAHSYSNSRVSQELNDIDVEEDSEYIPTLQELTVNEDDIEGLQNKLNQVDIYVTYLIYL